MLSKLLILSLVVVAAGKNLARTPPMGWMSWEDMRCDVDCTKYGDDCINEALYKAQTDELVKGGYLKAGYDGIHIDDCWETKNPPRNPEGQLVPNATRFPNGFKGLADYIHSRNVKFAAYTAESATTCGGYPASANHEDTDAKSFADWGVDYLKVDGCGPADYYPGGYKKMGEALLGSGRDIVYSCSWPAYLGDDETKKPYQTFIDIGCNLWRNWADIQCNWGSLSSIIDHFGDYSVFLKQFVASGHYNDMDMILAGNDCITDAEARTQMSIWSVMAAPLIMGNDLRNVTASQRAILLNGEVIAVNQDEKVEAGYRVSPKQAHEVWARNLSDSSMAVALFNKLGSTPDHSNCNSPYNVTQGGYLEACGGGAGNIAEFSDLSLAQAQAACCANSDCAGFDYNNSTKGGFYKRNSDCGFVKNSEYDGYNKPNFNPPQPTAADITVDFASLGLPATASFTVRDLWANKDVGVFKGSYTAKAVGFHDTAFLRLSPA